MNQVERVKVLLGIKDALQDDLLRLIQELTEAHFKAYTKASEIPTDLEYMIVEVMIRRFNRIGSEGYTSKEIEGLSMSFTQNDFQEYDRLLKVYYPNAFSSGGFRML